MSKLTWIAGAGSLVTIGMVGFALFGVAAKSCGCSSSSTHCLSNQKQVGTALAIYMADFDNAFPQTTVIAAQQGGTHRNPFVLLLPYTKSRQLFVCPTDPTRKPVDEQSHSIESSYAIKAGFGAGLKYMELAEPAKQIYMGERRTETVNGIPPTGAHEYRPSVPQDMDPLTGVLAVKRHLTRSNYLFADSHVKSTVWEATYDPGKVDLHTITRAEPVEPTETQK